jgi:hypothetical protein
MAESLIETSDETLSLYFGTLREDQNSATPRILIRINTGLNDRNEGLGPVDGSALPGNSAAAFNINIRAIIDRIKNIWHINGWNEEELFFCITVSHPISGDKAGVGDDAQLVGYRVEADDIAYDLERCAAVNMTKLTSYPEMLANNWYANPPSDTAHLRLAGYRELARRELAALQNGRTWYDFDGDGAIDIEDLYVFFQTNIDAQTAPFDFSYEGLLESIRYNLDKELR